MKRSDIVISVLSVPFVLFFLAQAFSEVIPGIVIPAPMTTGNTENTHPVADSNEIQGGAMQFAYSSQLRTIPEPRKRKGMLVYIAETDAYYQAYSTNGHYWRRWLVGGTGGGVTSHPNISDRDAADSHPINAITSLEEALAAKLSKAEFDALTSSFRVPGPPGADGADGYTPVKGVDYFDGVRGWDGRHGQTLTCAILHGTRSLTYSAAGQLVTSTIEPLFAYAYLDDQLVTPVAYSWYIPPTATQLKYPPIQPDGMQAKLEYFAYGAYSSYSASHNNNYAAVQVAISSTRQPYGRRYCEASVTIAINREGQQGIQGVPGDATNVTKEMVTGVFESTASDDTLVLQAATNSASQFEVREPGQNTVFWIDGLGNMYFKQADGSTVVKVLVGGSIVWFRNGVKRVEVMNDATITTYATDGTTRLFSLYSTGKWKGPEGWPATNGLYMTRNTDGTIVYAAGGSGGVPSISYDAATGKTTVTTTPTGPFVIR